jgi:purine catabolism regulator
MTVTISTLARHTPFGVVELVGSVEQRRVDWVHVSDLPDPVPFLSPGTLLLTTGLSVPVDIDDTAADAYITRVAAAGAAGIGFGIGLTHDVVPEAVIRKCQEVGLPLMVVPYDTRFADIAHFVADDATRSALRASRDAAEVERGLIRSLSAADPQSAIVRTLIRRTGGWGMLLDVDGGALLIEPPSATRELPIVRMEMTRVVLAGATSTWTRDGVSAALHRIEVDDDIHGYFAIGAAGSLADHQSVIAVALSLLAFQAERQVAIRRASRLLRSAIVQLLIGGLHEDAGKAATRAGIDLPESPVRVAVLLPAEETSGLTTLLDHAERDFTLTLINAIFAEDDTGGRLLVVFSSAEGDLEALSRVLASSGGGHAAVSEPTEIGNLPAAMTEANRLATTINSSSPPVLTRADVRGTGLLTYLDTPAVQGFVGALLIPLEEASKNTSIDLMHTLRVFLAADCSWAEASARLQVHRHTLRYRVRKIEEVLGRKLSDTSTRAELWVALQLLDAR